MRAKPACDTGHPAQWIMAVALTAMIALGLVGSSVAVRALVTDDLFAPVLTVDPKEYHS